MSIQKLHEYDTGPGTRTTEPVSIQQVWPAGSYLFCSMGMPGKTP